MNNVYQLLEQKGLVTQESILAKGTAWSTHEVIELNTGLDAALREDKQQYDSNSETDSEFRFFASASFRGDSGCDEPSCRAAKTRSLAKYAALYSDQVIVPVRVSPSFLHESADRLSTIDLLGTILCLWELRPLVDAGVIRLIPTSLYMCESCGRQFLSQATSAKDSIVKLIQKSSKSFSVYRSSLPIPLEFPGIVLEIRGPEEFLEHGCQIVMFTKPPDWAIDLKTSRSGRRREKLSTELVRKAGILEGTFSRLVSDAAIHIVYGARYHAKYLTNLPGDAAFISCLGELPAESIGPTSLLMQLTHQIPTMEDLHVQEILSLRAAEPEQFNQYRYALGTIIRDYIRPQKEVTEKEAREIYASILAPSVARLQTMASEHRRSTRSKAVKSGLYAMALISVGMYATHLAPQVATMLETLTGAELLRSTVDAVSSFQRDSNTARCDNLYFLYRLLGHTR